MPVIKNNSLIKGASGAYQGEFVYKQRGGKTFIAGMPTVKKKKAGNKNREKVMRKFGSASDYAVAAMEVPELKAFYATKVSGGNTAYNIAFRDFYRKPKVVEIDTINYNGTPGSQIAVSAVDDCKVTGVVVQIISADGVLIESGDAIFVAMNNARWIYSATEDNPELVGCRITAVAKDLPENEGSLEKIL
jgi:hypothetical protein